MMILVFQYDFALATIWIGKPLAGQIEVDEALGDPTATRKGYKHRRDFDNGLY